MKTAMRDIYLCITANMSWRTCVVVKQMQSPIMNFIDHTRFTSLLIRLWHTYLTKMIFTTTFMTLFTTCRTWRIFSKMSTFFTSITFLPAEFTIDPNPSLFLRWLYMWNFVYTMSTLNTCRSNWSTQIHVSHLCLMLFLLLSDCQ